MTVEHFKTPPKKLILTNILLQNTFSLKRKTFTTNFLTDALEITPPADTGICHPRSFHSPPFISTALQKNKTLKAGGSSCTH